MKISREQYNKLPTEYKQYFNKDYKYCNVSKDIIKNPIFDNRLKELIDKTFKDTYDKNNVSSYFIKGIKDAKLIHSVIINDRFGVKKFILRLIENFSFGRLRYISSYSTHINNPNYGFLNLEKKVWNHPVKKDLIYNYSFPELFNISLDKCLKIIKNVNKVLYEDKDINTLKKVIPNVSYSNGLLLEDYEPMRYFEY